MRTCRTERGRRGADAPHVMPHGRRERREAGDSLHPGWQRARGAVGTPDSPPGTPARSAHCSGGPAGRCPSEADLRGRHGAPRGVVPRAHMPMSGTWRGCACARPVKGLGEAPSLSEWRPMVGEGRSNACLEPGTFWSRSMLVAVKGSPSDGPAGQSVDLCCARAE